VSRDTISAQVAGAGSQKLAVTPSAGPGVARYARSIPLERHRRLDNLRSADVTLLGDGRKRTVALVSVAKSTVQWVYSGD